jgi:CubicO group peptidase (beta-lactamase class C family)
MSTDLQKWLADLAGRASPGLQYTAVDDASTLFVSGAGLADLASRRPMLPGTTMMAYSMSKTFTAAAVLQLAEAGRLDVDDPVARFVSWQPYGDAITVRQLLCHTSGIPNPIPLRWVHSTAAHPTFDERAEFSKVLNRYPKLAFAPGTRFRYSNIGYWLLGTVIEQASGERFVDYMERRVLRELDIPAHELSYRIVDPAVHASGYLEKYSFINLIKRWLIETELIGEYSGRWLRIRDHYLNGPAFGGLVGSSTGIARFLRDQLCNSPRMFSRTTRDLFLRQQRTASGPIPMTLGWHIGLLGRSRYFFKEGGGGGFRCMMRIYPERQLGTVVMANATTVDVKALLDRADREFFGRSAASAS